MNLSFLVNDNKAKYDHLLLILGKGFKIILIERHPRPFNNKLAEQLKSFVMLQYSQTL